MPENKRKQFKCTLFLYINLRTKYVLKGKNANSTKPQISTTNKFLMSKVSIRPNQFLSI